MLNLIVAVVVAAVILWLGSYFLPVWLAAVLALAAFVYIAFFGPLDRFTGPRTRV